VGGGEYCGGLLYDVGWYPGSIQAGSLAGGVLLTGVDDQDPYDAAGVSQDDEPESQFADPDAGAL
jgi:hypothetical protein